MSGPLNLHPKVSAPLLASYVTAIVLYSLDRWAGIDPPVEVGVAIAGVITFVCGWLAPSQPAPDERAKR